MSENWRTWNGVSAAAVAASLMSGPITAGFFLVHGVLVQDTERVDQAVNQVLTQSGPAIVVLPGPPRELQAMWAAAIQTEAFKRASAGAVDYERFR